MYLFLWEEGVGAGGVVMKPPPQGTRSAHRAELCRHLQGRDPGLAPVSGDEGTRQPFPEARGQQAW